jgi:hypothetical protein
MVPPTSFPLWYKNIQRYSIVNSYRGHEPRGGAGAKVPLLATTYEKQQLEPIDEHPVGRDLALAHLGDHSHPDDGKTTLTKRSLLFGGAVQLAGELKARGARRRVRSDWMAVDRECGISVFSAVMSFEQKGPGSIVRYGRGTDGCGDMLGGRYGVWTRRILDGRIQPKRDFPYCSLQIASTVMFRTSLGCTPQQSAIRSAAVGKERRTHHIQFPCRPSGTR